MTRREEAIPLLEDIDPMYEPSDAEVREYGSFLGIAAKDEDLLWIARQGLIQALPAPWQPFQAAADGKVFYFNAKTGQSQWGHPLDELNVNLVRMHQAAQAEARGWSDTISRRSGQSSNDIQLNTMRNTGGFRATSKSKDVEDQAAEVLTESALVNELSSPRASEKELGGNQSLINNSCSFDTKISQFVSQTHSSNDEISTNCKSISGCANSSHPIQSGMFEPWLEALEAFGACTEVQLSAPSAQSAAAVALLEEQRALNAPDAVLATQTKKSSDKI